MCRACWTLFVLIRKKKGLDHNSVPPFFVSSPRSAIRRTLFSISSSLAFCLLSRFHVVLNFCWQWFEYRSDQTESHTFGQRAAIRDGCASTGFPFWQEADFYARGKWRDPGCFLHHRRLASQSITWIRMWSGCAWMRLGINSCGRKG